MPTYTEPVGENWKYNPEYHRLCDFLGINVFDRNEYTLAQKLSVIRDWAGEKKSINDALWTIKGLQKKLGIQGEGKPLIHQLYEYIRLSNDRPEPTPRVKKTQPKSKEDVTQIIKDVAKQVGKEVAKSIASTKEEKVKEKPAEPEKVEEVYQPEPQYYVDNTYR